jgi:hypothetical protein
MSTSTGVEAPPFMGGVLHPDLKRMLPSLRQLDAGAVETLTDAVVAAELTAPDADLDQGIAERLEALRVTGADPDPAAALVFSGVRRVVRETLRAAAPRESLDAFETEYKFPKGFAAAVVGAAARIAKGRRRGAGSSTGTGTGTGAGAGGVGLPTVDDVRWRVDATVSTSAAARVLRPLVTLEITDSLGQVHLIEAGPEQFHELRYGLALALKSAQDAGRHRLVQESAKRK